jgi:flavin-dependent dehydrogenase
LFLPVGDAAMQFDPLEGQGVARALDSALAAAKAICSRIPEAALRDYAEQLRLLFARHLRERQRLYEIAGSALR